MDVKHCPKCKKPLQYIPRTGASDFQTFLDRRITVYLLDVNRCPTCGHKIGGEGE